MKWVALYSQTGSELTLVCGKLERNPDIVLSNNTDAGLVYKSHKDIEKFLMTLEPSLITLHGYLRILSPEVCERHTIINGHPALIHVYPELRGKDPQERWFNNDKYTIMGTVLHYCIPEVDAGEIISYMEASTKPASLNDTFSQLKAMSVILWYNLLKELL